ncbi:MAG: response regulator transcription factor, partial [Acetatifactor sp.]|nr:response regulator transcription factor [Acetatifactor sp.]
MFYKIAICDDESVHIEKIRTILSDYETDNYLSSAALLDAVSSGVRYDVLFLDIVMPGIDGVSLARELREFDEDMLIVFITSKIEYMQTGYEVRAFRYLLKDQIDEGLPKIWNDIIKELLDRQDAYFSYEFERKVYRLPIRDILYFESNLRRIVVHTKASENATLYGKLDDLSVKYSSFIRVHKSYLINRRYIRMISAGTVVLSNGEVLPVSR